MYFKRSGRLKLEANYRLTRDPLARVLVRDFGFDDAEVSAMGRLRAALHGIAAAIHLVPAYV